MTDFPVSSARVMLECLKDVGPQERTGFLRQFSERFGSVEIRAVILELIGDGKVAFTYIGDIGPCYMLSKQAPS